MNDDEINRRIAEAHQKLSGQQAEGGGAPQNPGDVLAYGNANAIPFKEMKRIPSSEYINEQYGKLANKKVGEKEFSKTWYGGPITGIAEGLSNWASSAANVPLGWMNAYTEPTDLSEYLNYEPGVEGNINRYGYMGGNVAGSIAPDIAAYLAGGAALKGMTGLPGLTARTGLGAGIGYLGGEHGPGGRAGGAALGTAGSLVGEAQAGRIAGRMTKQMENEAAKLAPGYEKTLGKLSKVDYPYGSNELFELVGPGNKFKLTEKTEESVYKFAQSGTPQDAKAAISALKREQRALETVDRPTYQTMTGERRKIYQKLDKSIEHIENEIEKGFLQQGLTSELGELEKLDKLYAGKVAPYKMDALSKFEHGTSKAPEEVLEFLKAMKKDSRMLPGGKMNAFEYLMKKNPEIYLNKLIPRLTPERSLMAALLSGLLGPVPNNSITQHGGD